MTRANPSHPGRGLRDDFDALGITLAEAAAHIKVEESALAAICDGDAPITADMAVRFEQAFGSTAEFWLRRQANYDLAQVRKTCDKIERLEVAA